MSWQAGVAASRPLALLLDNSYLFHLCLATLPPSTLRDSCQLSFYDRTKTRIHTEHTNDIRNLVYLTNPTSLPTLSPR